MKIKSFIKKYLCKTPFIQLSSKGTGSTRAYNWQPKVYTLQKDIPMFDAGTRFQQSFQSDNIYFAGRSISALVPEKDQVGIITFEASYVEQNPEWFSEVKLHYR